MPQRFASAHGSANACARPFLRLHFADPEHRARAVQQACGRTALPAVVEALRVQNAALTASPARDANIEALAHAGTVAVVSGQQVGLFLGPLYTIYKAATAVCIARALAQETGVRAVPVFWLQTEDHDFAEIAACHVPRADGSVRTLAVRPSAGERTPVWHHTLGQDIDACVRDLASELDHLPFGKEHCLQVARHYQAGARLAAAFAGLLAELFAEQGLVVLDPRDPALARCTAAVHRRALVDAERISERLEQRGEALRAAGFEPTVYVRKRAPLSFFQPDAADGPRYRLHASAGGYALVGDPSRQWSREALLSQLEQEPACFSTSALLRPIYQDTCLPTAAYVAGPGEIDYFAQVDAVYDLFDLPAPLMVPRGHFFVLERKIHAAMQSLGVRAQDTGSEQELLARAAPATPPQLDADTLRDEALGAFHDGFDAAADHVVRVYPDLRAAADKTVATVHKAVSRFANKIRNAHLHSDQRRVELAQRIRRALFPDGQAQERLLSLPYFAARYGPQQFIAAVMQAYTPYQTGWQQLTP